jgi:16S rRNA (uracil1498-N3)-methyltransferase
MDDVIQRAVEIGVDRIIPVFCRHGVSKPVQDDSKIERWRKIAISAIKQSSQSWLPEMCFPHSLSAGLDLCQNHALCYGSLQADSRALYDWHQSVDAGLHLGLAIGPEGDFHQEELDLFSTRNVAPIWLGPHIMRSETATLAGLAQLNAMRHAADPNSG